MPYYSREILHKKKSENTRKKSKTLTVLHQETYSYVEMAAQILDQSNFLKFSVERFFPFGGAGLASISTQLRSTWIMQSF